MEVWAELSSLDGDFWRSKAPVLVVGGNWGSRPIGKNSSACLCPTAPGFLFIYFIDRLTIKAEYFQLDEIISNRNTVHHNLLVDCWIREGLGHGIIPNMLLLEHYY